MEDIIINGTEYSNLQTTYSEKNNITNIYGKEYEVNGTEVSTFDIIEDDYINANGEVIVEYYEHDDNIKLSNIPSNYYPIKRVGKEDSTLNLNNLGGSYTYDIVRLRSSLYYMRQENIYITGKFRAITKNVIVDTNNISVSYNISYNEYLEEYNRVTIANPPQLFDTNNYRGTRLLFEIIRSNNNLKNKDESGNVYEQLTENRIPSEPSKYIHKVFWITTQEVQTGDGMSICQLSKPKIISTNEDGTTVEINYKISIWFGSHTWDSNETVVASTNYKNRLNTATKIKFTVQANTIKTTETDFSYGDELENQYELESNELMQYTQGQVYNTRQSYISSNKMLEKTFRHRIIVSFDLLNCVKRKFGQIDTDADGNPIYEERMLKEGDLIKIKDVNDNFIGEYYDDNGNLVIPYFEIISYHGRWDGKFHVEVICKQVL